MVPHELTFNTVHLPCMGDKALLSISWDLSTSLQGLEIWIEVAPVTGKSVQVFWPPQNLVSKHFGFCCCIHYQWLLSWNRLGPRELPPKNVLLLMIKSEVSLMCSEESVFWGTNQSYKREVSSPSYPWSQFKAIQKITEFDLAFLSKFTN